MQGLLGTVFEESAYKEAAASSVQFREEVRAADVAGTTVMGLGESWKGLRQRRERARDGT